MPVRGGNSIFVLFCGEIYNLIDFRTIQVNQTFRKLVRAYGCLITGLES